MLRTSFVLAATLLSLFGTASFADDTQPAEAHVDNRCNENPRLPGCPYWCRFHRNDPRCPDSPVTETPASDQISWEMPTWGEF